MREMPKVGGKLCGQTINYRYVPRLGDPHRTNDLAPWMVVNSTSGFLGEVIMQYRMGGGGALVN